MAEPAAAKDEESQGGEGAEDGGNGNGGGGRGGFWNQWWKPVGIMLTATVAGVGAWVGAERQFHHEEQANADRAQAVARVMVAGFDAAVLNLCQIGTRGSWYVTFVPLRSPIPNDDRLLLAQAMSDEVRNWQVVEDADSRLSTWDAVQRGVVGAPVDPIDWGFKGIIRKLTDARRALEPTAGYDADNQAKFRQTCKEQRDWKPPPKPSCVVPSGLRPEDAARWPSCDTQRKQFYKRHPELLEGPPLP